MYITFKYTFALLLLLKGIVAPPVTQNKNKETEANEVEANGLEDYMEYHRYLKEVVSALESDPEFRKKIDLADEKDIRSGKIAEELEFVSHHVRTRLDEIKRLELERLKELTEKKLKLENNENSIDEDPTHNHLDHSNPHTFEIEDLKKLIAKTTEDLAEADKKRKEEFKEYEMQKEFEKQNKLNHTNGSEREKLEKEFKEAEEKHKKHEKLHEPGHKAQLEEVWEEQDQMQQEFDPKTFFMLHDIDGNGLWDQDEVKALFIKELDKMYQEGAPEDDMRERAEEMERMRESVYKEVDTNRDGFIDFNEFAAQTRSREFKEDHGWQGLDERKPYTQEELEEYIRQHQAAQMAHGYYPAPPGHPQGYQAPPGYHPNAIPPGPQFHPGNLPQNPPQPLPGQMNNHINPQPNYHPQGNYQQQPYQHPQAPPMNYQHPPVQYQQQQQNYEQPPPPNYQQQGNNQQPQIPQQQFQQQQANQQPPVNQQQQQLNQQNPPRNDQQHGNQQPPQVHQQIPQNDQQKQNVVADKQQNLNPNPVPAGNVNPGVAQPNLASHN